MNKYNIYTRKLYPDLTRYEIRVKNFFVFWRDY